MTKTNWWEEAIIYQIYPMSFKDSNNDGVGDINGLIEKLDYIQSLGVNTLWINPITLSNHLDNGYDVIDYKKVDPLFGSEEDKDRFIEEAKKRDFKIIFDFPLNHTSDQHPWFKQALKGKEDPHRGYYIWADAPEGDPYPNNWTAGFGGSAWSKEMNGDQFYLHLFMKQMPDLNWDNKELRKEMAEVIKYWIDRGIDGVRLDAFIYLDVDKEFPEHPEEYGEAQEVTSHGDQLQEYLAELNERIGKNDHEIFILGEATSADAEKTAWYTRDDMVDKVITLEYFTEKEDEKIEELPQDNQHATLDLKKFKKMQKDFQETVSEKGGPILFWNNHDRPRSPQKYGDTENYRTNTNKMMATLMYLQKGIPILYYGEEIGMNNAAFDDPGNISDAGVMDFYDAAREYGFSHEEAMKHLNLTTRDASRGIMQWKNEKGVGFTQNAASWIKYNQEEKYNVEEQENDPSSILHYYRKLMELKKRPLFTKGEWKLLETTDDCYVYERNYHTQKALVCCNFSKSSQKLSIGEEFSEAPIMLETEEINKTDEELELPPYGACVIIKE